ncbi:thioredoxin-dependent thiol peroxidase [Herbiconiux sp. KACC 21604]|uniref:thioredoxin-dependent thiol peroxidase n=1 Tax=unclassified Herbiconiux TaxID=2618217 RepID=UPI001490F9B3|nr:thioredoxin-dependent thiol peroxidase [Herbiconiux sp. SALV-R1]QJU54387.1 thioredoxin-dependent thiol peroxidase [Herbiconiux sp. SALV-R1]WPO85458.1 thioredoxin-dependent thiol peroxidase [Herbiconiux sp. KACC 21604]
MTDTTARIQAGDTAPEFTLVDEDGVSRSLADYRGQRVILYFYPEAGTPGCTTEACDFRDNLNSLKSAGYTVLGVSRDKPAKLRGFVDEQNLNFTLLSDPDSAVHELYSAWGEKSLYGKTVVGVIRSTFVIDEQGVVTLALYNVKATGHVASLRKKLGVDA